MSQSQCGRSPSQVGYRWPITLSGRLPIVDLVGRYLTNYLIGREPTPYRIAPLTPEGCPPVVLCGISTTFAVLSPCKGQVAHALLTRPPLEQCIFKSNRNLPIRRMSPLDLHVLGTPPAFVLSQDQTLPFNPSTLSCLNSLESSLNFLRVSLCIVFKVRLPVPLTFVRASSTIIPKPHPLVKNFFENFYHKKTPIP